MTAATRGWVSAARGTTAAAGGSVAAGGMTGAATGGGGTRGAGVGLVAAIIGPRMGGVVAVVVAAAVIPAAAVAGEAMSTPAVSVTPVGPGTDAEEDAVVEVAGAVEAHGCAGVGLVVVVAVLADGLNADFDDDLRVGSGRKSGKSAECESCGDAQGVFCDGSLKRFHD